MLAFVAQWVSRGIDDGRATAREVTVERRKARARARARQVRMAAKRAQARGVVGDIAGDVRASKEVWRVGIAEENESTAAVKLAQTKLSTDTAKLTHSPLTDSTNLPRNETTDSVNLSQSICARRGSNKKNRRCARGLSFLFFRLHIPVFLSDI